MVVDAVEVKGFVLRQRVTVPPRNGRSQSKHEAIISFLTEDPNEFRQLMKVYWDAGEDPRIIEALPGDDVYSTPGITIQTVSLTSPNGGDASSYLSREQKSVLGLA